MKTKENACRFLIVLLRNAADLLKISRRILTNWSCGSASESPSRGFTTLVDIQRYLSIKTKQSA